MSLSFSTPFHNSLIFHNTFYNSFHNNQFQACFNLLQHFLQQISQQSIPSMLVVWKKDPDF